MSTLFEETPPPDVVPWVECFRLTIDERPEQRGSKVPIVLYDKATKLPRLDKHGRVMLFAKDDNPRSEAYMKRVHKLAKAAWGNRDLIPCPIALAAEFYFARPQGHWGTGRNASTLKASAPAVHAQSPDLAKLLRCVEDALTKAIWVDDKLVCRYAEPTGRRWADDGRERTELRIFIPEGVTITEF